MTKLEAYLEQVGPVPPLPELPSEPIFSILVRTTGSRPELLEEALLSIGAQTEESYEVLLLVHNGDRGAVESGLGKLPAFLQARIRVLDVIGGGRSRPLNHGIEQAQGKFVCVLDDDDLLLPNHLESVVGSTASHLALQTFGANRYVEIDGEGTYPYWVSRIEIGHTRRFSLLRQLQGNYIPICNLFVSRALLLATGVRYDESLEVFEDWQFLMDVNRYVEIECVPVVTTIVNMRSNESNTIRVPAMQTEWIRTGERMRERLVSQPRLVSPKELQDLADYGAKIEAALEFRDRYRRLAPVLKILLSGARLAKRTLPEPVKRKLRRPKAG